LKNLIQTTDKSHKALVEVKYPKNEGELINFFIKNNKIITIGSGLTFVPNFFSEKGTSVSLEKFEEKLFINEYEGYVEAGAGLKISTILNFIIKKNYIIKILPGWPSVTLGGCIANNVHGKNPYNDGIFEEVVKEIKILTPDGNIVLANRVENSELFFNTCGGYGLTGIILSAKIKLQKIINRTIVQKKYFVSSVSETINILKKNTNSYASYAWHDYSLFENRWGKGIVFICNASAENIKIAKKEINSKININKIYQPFNFFNSITITIFNFFYYYKNLLKRSNKQDILSINFPINNFPLYFMFLLNGKKGFVEYQIIIPFESFDNFIEKLKEKIFIHKIQIYGNLVKIFNGKQERLNFNQKGVCMNLQFLNNKKNSLFFNEIDELVLEHNGITALYKDSRISLEKIKKQYKENYEKFILFLKKNDPQNKFNSIFSIKIGK
jgi:decaprenylphospho-beta-D-ribofuranose 2-oxidase